MAIDRDKGVRVVAVGTLLAEDNLVIPPYQRPYSWEPVTAVQLLDDIREASRRADGQRASEGADPAELGSYVLGAVILHLDEETHHLHVVDGQQRLLTLTMLLDLLDQAHTDADPAVPGASDEDPQSPVVRARSALKRRLRLLDEDPQHLAAFIRRGCEVIRVETDDPDEAFRVFDSQNYRGKALLPHDLLKAYHLREMRDQSESMRAALVEGWEAVPDADLDRLFSTYLWRIKRWSRGQSAPRFSTRHVDTFKGLTTRTSTTPSARYHLAAQAAVPMLAAWSGHSAVDARATGRSRFQLDAPVIAGRAFFEMVTFMLHELKRLRGVGFDEPGWDKFASTDDELRENPSRARYRYVSELYLAALLYYTNKFGDDEIREARHRLFAWAYGPRTRLQRVQMASVNNHARNPEDGRSAFVLLRNAESAAELRRLVSDVKGREQDSEHERDLLTLLRGLTS